MFVWREPGEARFYEVKVGKKDDINLNQCKFVERALGLGHRLEDFMIIEVPKPTPRIFMVSEALTFISKLHSRTLTLGKMRTERLPTACTDESEPMPAVPRGRSGNAASDRL